MAVIAVMITVQSFLHRRAQDVQQVVVSPQELPRLQIPRRYLNEYIALIQEYVPLVPAELIFNLDETGLSDWEERKRKPVLIRQKSMGMPFIIQWTGEFDTKLFCVAFLPLGMPTALCSSLPLPVLDLCLKWVFEMGVRDGIDRRVQIAPSPYITPDMFLQYLRDIREGVLRIASNLR